MRTIDATCPLVTKVHAEAVRYANLGLEILLIGHADHQEVIGTYGEAPESIRIIESEDDAKSVSVQDPSNLVYLTQTTLSTDDAEKIISILQERFPLIKGPPGEDICYATTNRQEAVKVIGQGTGLGLSISQDIIQRHGGTLTATSAPGEGTRIDIRLPLAEKKRAHAA